MSEHAGRGSWCNAEGIAMETNGRKAQARRRGLNRKQEITASYHGGEDGEGGGSVVWSRGERPADK